MGRIFVDRSEGDATAGRVAAWGRSSQHLGARRSRRVLEIRGVATIDAREARIISAEGSNWMTRPQQVTAKAWKADIQLLADTHRTLRQAVATLDPA